MSIDGIYSVDELVMAKSIRREIEIPVKFYSNEEIIDWEVFCDNANNGHRLDITTGLPLPSLSEWLNRK